jgi:flavin-dependent dehydrogenase
MSKKESVRSVLTELENYDLVILGGGTGGTIAAWTLAKLGQRFAVIERAADAYARTIEGKASFRMVLVTKNGMAQTAA